MAKAATRKATKRSSTRLKSSKKGGSARKATPKRGATPKKKAATRSRKSAAKASRKKATVRGGSAPARKKKAVAKKRTTKKATMAKTATRKRTAKKAPARKAAAKKAATRKTAAKKPPTRKAGAKTAARPATKAARRAAAQAERKAQAQARKIAKAEAKAKEAREAAAREERELKKILAELPYREGQFVVHPKYGLGRIEHIHDRRLSTRTVPCLDISFSYQEMRLTIPVDQVARSGLRRPISRRQIEEVFKALRGRATFDAKRRSAKRVVDYRKRLSQGDPISLAEAIRDLGRLSLKKSLSYEERKILSTALRILSREVALARGREPDDVREEIEKIVYR